MEPAAGIASPQGDSQLAKEVLGGSGRIRRADSLAQNLANQVDRRDGILGQPP